MANKLYLIVEERFGYSTHNFSKENMKWVTPIPHYQILVRNPNKNNIKTNVDRNSVRLLD